MTTSQADPLATIQQLDPMFVDIQQSSADLLALRRALASSGVTPAQRPAVRLKLEDGSDYADRRASSSPRRWSTRPPAR